MEGMIMKNIKNIAKVTVSVALLGAMSLSMTGCDISDVGKTGKEIMGGVFDLDKDVSDFLNEDDDDYDFQVEYFEDMLEVFEDSLDLKFDDIKANKTNINVKNKKATVNYSYPIEGEVFEFELNLVKDGDDWVIDDNEEFIVDVADLYFEIIDEVGSKSQKKAIKEFCEEADCDLEDAGQALYDSEYKVYDLYGEYIPIN